MSCRGLHDVRCLRTACEASPQARKHGTTSGVNWKPPETPGARTAHCTACNTVDSTQHAWCACAIRQYASRRSCPAGRIRSHQEVRASVSAHVSPYALGGSMHVDIHLASRIIHVACAQGTGSPLRHIMPPVWVASCTTRTQACLTRVDLAPPLCNGERTHSRRTVFPHDGHKLLRRHIPSHLLA